MVTALLAGVYAIVVLVLGQRFGARLREQVDLDTLSGELLAVVDQTMQPTTASLWLRPSAQPLASGRG